MTPRRMTEAEYDALEGLRSSHLKVLHERSPAHMREAMLRPRRDTEAFRFGRALHCAVLRPDELDLEWMRGGKHDRRTKEGKLAAQREEEEAQGREILAADDWDRMLEMREAVLAACGDLLSLAPLREYPVVGMMNDVPIKARLDAASPTGMLLDLKTTICASPRAFARSAASFGYLLQLAHYRMTMRIFGLGDGPTLLIACEKERPFATAVYIMDAAQMQRMEDRILQLLDLYRRCRDAGEWPAYDSDIKHLPLPEWAFTGQTELEDMTDAE